ncbi:hypothetical protein ACERII_18590 [Evansella sp. AB-rgal1]|uniref:hypothetical protein n=1 Tax=Evansella sp. AB-rgal1 TaxID=3242696 RepID=UPI00359DAA4F
MKKRSKPFLKKLKVLKRGSVLIVLVAMISTGVIVYGSSHWNEQVTKANAEAVEYALRDHNGNRAIGSSQERPFSMEEAEENDSVENVEGEEGQPGSNNSNSNSNSGASTNTSGNGTSSNTSTSNGNNANNDSSSSVLSIAEIKNVYLRQFESLQSEEHTRIEKLAAEARVDYELMRAGQSEWSSSELQLHYIERIEVMEAEADARFNEIYRELTSALEENGHNKQEAEEFRIIYDTLKEERRLDAVDAMLGN